MRGPLLITLPIAMLATALAAQDFEGQRRKLLDEVREDVRFTSGYLDRDELAPAVLAALGKVPRHEFVPPDLRRHAYENRPLPIGYGQTISQPYIVAIMTDLLELEAGDAVLEVGTGSGYQAAILAELVAQVYSIEIIPELGREVRQRLTRLGYDKVATRIGDGYHGWPEHAPFDAIIVTAAGSHVPPPLLAQLRPGGRMVLPVGGPFSTQQLVLLTKTADGEVQSRQVLPVAFVPLTGEH
ncbi:MAG: protein-L-isoaspartate(D-aspartate) O-methyltransferase [Acidobacteriota bacterium]|nr:protein-L-isoaspartate(D-aspartate) O-methyltransferase [Acidobacteriota bacterium]MDH3522906.1 protein-L-isoaspartate(D-aspartate) O-methyltransferase [Acidobacteriota bacterium]